MGMLKGAQVHVPVGYGMALTIGWSYYNTTSEDYTFGSNLIAVWLLVTNLDKALQVFLNERPLK